MEHSLAKELKAGGRKAGISSSRQGLNSALCLKGRSPSLATGQVGWEPGRRLEHVPGDAGELNCGSKQGGGGRWLESSVFKICLDLVTSWTLEVKESESHCNYINFEIRLFAGKTEEGQ